MSYPSVESVKERLRAKGWFEENLIAVGAIIYSGVLARKCLIVDHPDWPSAYAIGFLGLFVFYANWSKLQKKKFEVEKEKSVIHLDAAQDTIYDIILQHWKVSRTTNEDDDHGLRICIFHHDEANGMLEQLTEYTGEEIEEQKVGRRFSSKVGVIGQCVITKAPAYGRRNSDGNMTDFVTEMGRDYNYSPEEVLELSYDRFSWIAMPIIMHGKVKAVLFCDSKLEDFFGNNNGPRYNLLTYSALGLARHFKRS